MRAAWDRANRTNGYLLASASLALMCLLLPEIGRAQSFGRLFSTPEVRATLDELRAEHEYGKPVVAAREQRLPAVPNVTINGVVLRSDGPDASWVNGNIITSGEPTPEGVRVEARGEAAGAVRIVLPQSRKTVELKAGQRIDLVKGRVLDAYERSPIEGVGLHFEPADLGTGLPPDDGGAVDSEPPQRAAED